MRTILALAVGGILFSLAAQAVAQNDTVAEVRVEGNKSMSVEAVLTHVKTQTGEPYDQKLVDADLRSLLATGRFESVVVSKSQTDKGVIVTFQVVERPLVAKIGFSGHTAFQGDELLKDLAFRVGDALSEAAVRQGRDAIATKYRDAGYYDVYVEFDPKLLKDAREVLYTIREGPRTHVASVLFEGNARFSDFWLRQKVDTSRRRWPFITGKLEMDQVARDVQSLKEMYESDGFLDVEVGRDLTFSADRAKATVKFVIQEGPQYHVGRIVFRGNQTFSSEQLVGRLAVAPGAIFTSLKLRRAIEAVESAYGQVGYIDAKVAARKILQEKPGLVDLEFAIEEGGQFRIGKIDVRGNRVTKEGVVRQQLNFYPDQRFDTVAMEDSRRGLTESGLFKEVAIRPIAAPGALPDIRDVLVQVQEGQTANILLGAGVSTDSGLIGNIAFSERNFDIMNWPRSFGDVLRGEAWRGGGQLFRVSAEPGTNVSRFSVEWREPYLFYKPYSLGLRAYVFQRDRDTYDEQRVGLVASLGHRFPNRWYGEVAGRIESVDIRNLSDDAPPEVIADSGSHSLFGIRGSLVRDTTDSRWLPSKGDRFSVGYEQVFGGYSFSHLDASYNYYHTVFVDALDRPHVLKTRLAGGQIFGDAPVFEKYYGGGIAWVRGFEYRGISPRSAGTDEVIGGDFILFAGEEYEFPIFGGQSSNMLRGVAFLDTGTVEKDFGVTTYRASVGVGLRWYVQFMGPVPISLDFAVPISKDSEDDTQIFSFTIGWSF